ncbi:MAG TPA: MBL fold metallo-hydrolase [Ferruginibacter sp.]|nr:MBL fold metallo-hydrolase [Ferruginibacter sp.]
MLQIKSFVFNPVEENTYIIYNEFNDCVIIDPGCYYDEEKDKLFQYINEMGLKPQKLLNTHCHLDHVFGNRFIAEKFSLELHIHPKDKPVLDYAAASGLMYNLPFDNYSGKLVFLEEGQSIVLGEDTLNILFTPGHSPGSISFYSPAYGFIISGDVLFHRSIGRTDIPLGDHDTLIKSIKEKLLVLPDETIVHSGHGPITTIGEEKKYNPFLT